MNRTINMKAALKVLGFVFLAGLLYRPTIHFACLPYVVHSSWVEILDTENSGLRGVSELPPLDSLSKDYRYFGLVVGANKQKLRLLDVYNAAAGKYGLYRRFGTVEGDPIYTWLLAQDGRLTYIEDDSQDGGAPPWEVHSYIPKTFRIGFMRGSKFVEGKPTSSDSPVIVLELDIGKYDKVYFY